MRISKRVEKLLIEKQLDAWRSEVIAQGRQYLDNWASQNGVSRHQFQVGTLLRKLSLDDKALEENEIASKQLQ